MEGRLVRRKVHGNRIHVNVPTSPMDNVTFHYETNVWKYVFQRRITCKRELSKKAFDCIDIM